MITSRSKCRPRNNSSTLFNSLTVGPQLAKGHCNRHGRAICTRAEFDIKAAFDHVLLMKAVRTHVRENWILLYIERWLTAPFETDEGFRIPRERGTPQGGVATPILMNLFMHYAFDCWMKRNFPQCPFARYADDAVVHCRSLEQAQEAMQAIASRLAECGLTMHPEKSKIVYCKDRSPPAPEWLSSL